MGRWACVRYFGEVSSSGLPVIRLVIGSFRLKSSAAPDPMVWSSIHVQLSTRNVAGNWLRRVLGYA